MSTSLTYIVTFEMLAVKLSGVTVRFASCTVTSTSREKWYTAAKAIPKNNKIRGRIDLLIIPLGYLYKKFSKNDELENQN